MFSCHERILSKANATKCGLIRLCVHFWIFTMPSSMPLICTQCVRRFNRLASHSLLHKVYSLSFRHCIVQRAIQRPTCWSPFLLCGSYFRCCCALDLIGADATCFDTIHTNVPLSQQANPLLIGSIRIDTYFRHVHQAKYFLMARAYWFDLQSLTYEQRMTFLCPRWS